MEIELAYKEDSVAVDEKLDFLGSFESESDKLNCPVVPPAFDVRLDLERVGDRLLTRATPHLAASQQRLPQVKHVKWSASTVRVFSRHSNYVI